MIELLTEEQINIGTIKKYNKGTHIYHEGDKCDKTSFILDGEIKIVSYNKDGNEDIYNHLYKGDCFANVLIFVDNGTFLGDVVAIKNSTILSFSKEQILKIMSLNKNFLEAFLRKTSQEFLSLKSTIKLLSKRDNSEKFLYYLKINNGKTNKSITKIADILCINRVSLSRIVSALLTKKIIKREHGEIILIKE